MISTRTMRRVGLGLLLGAGTIFTAEGAEPQFKGTAEFEKTPVLVSNFSPDKQAATLIFAHVEVAVGGHHTAPLADSLTTTVLLPVTTADRDVRICHYLRGYASTTGSGKATLLLRSGNVTQAIDLSKARETKDAVKAMTPALKLTRENATQAAKQQLPPAQPAPTSTDFFVPVEVVVPAKSSHKVTLVLLADRSNADDDSSAMIQLDSLDVEIQPATPAKSSR